IEDHYAIVGVKRPPRLELDGSRERSPALRRGVDALERLQVPRRRGEEPVRDRHRSAAALAQCSKHQAIPEWGGNPQPRGNRLGVWPRRARSEEHTSELQSRGHLVCRLLLEKKKKNRKNKNTLHKHKNANKYTTVH